MRTSLLLLLAFLIYGRAFAHADDTALIRQLFKSVIKKDHDQTRQLLRHGANPNALLDNFFLPLTPLTIAIGADDTLSQRILLSAGARSTSGGSELMVAVWFNRHQALERLLADAGSQDEEEFFYIALKSLNPVHWTRFCSTLSEQLDSVSIDSLDLYTAYRILRKLPPDAEPALKARTLVALWAHKTPDAEMLKELSAYPEVVQALSSSPLFVQRLKEQPLCSRVDLIGGPFFRQHPEIRSAIFQSLRDEKDTLSYCYRNLYEYHLPSVIKSADLRSFHEYLSLLPPRLDNPLGRSISLDFLFTDTIREAHYQMVEILMNRGLQVGERGRQPYSAFSHLSMNRIPTEYRDKLFDHMLAALEKDTAALDAAYEVTREERFLYALLDKGAHPERGLRDKLESLIYRRVPAEVLSHILERCRFLPGIDSVVTFMTENPYLNVDQSYFEVIKRSILQQTLVRSGVPHYSLKQIDEIRLRKLQAIQNSIRFSTTLFIKHYRAGAPTALIVNEPIAVPPFNRFGVSSTVKADTFAYTENGVLHRSLDLDLRFSAPTYTVPYDQLYIDNVALLKKGDKFQFTASSEINIPRVPFDPASELFFPAAELLIQVSDKAAQLRVAQNGQEFTLKPSTFQVIDLTRGDIKISVPTMQGWNVYTNVNLRCNYRYDHQSDMLFNDYISGSFSDKERLGYYARLYVQTAYSDDITRQKNAAVSANIISSLMYHEKYPQYIAASLEDAAKKIARIDENVNNFRQFYVLHKKITAQHILDLQLLLRQINLSEVQDPALRSGLQNLSRQLEQNAQEQEILDQYLQVFSSQYFEDLSYEIQRYQGLVLELAQFLSDGELLAEYRRRGLDVPAITKRVAPAENKISAGSLNGRGAFLKTLISK